MKYEVENFIIPYNEEVTFHINPSGYVVKGKVQYVLNKRTRIGNLPCKVGTKEECEEQLNVEIEKLANAEPDSEIKKAMLELMNENFSKVVG